MIGLSIDVRGIAGVRASLDRIPRELQGRALSAAINKTAQKARAEVARTIPREYAVKAAEVRGAMDLRSARGADLSSTLSIFGNMSRRGRSANMIHFLAVAVASGMGFKTRGAVGVKKKDLGALKQQLGFIIRKGGGLKKIEGAFIGNRGRTIFIRRPGTAMASRSKYSGTKHAEEIDALQVIGFSQMFMASRIHDKFMAKLKEDFGVEIERAVKMILSRMA